MSDNDNNNSGLGTTVSSTNKSGFDVVSELLSPTQIINSVTPSIQSLLNNDFSTCT